MRSDGCSAISIMPTAACDVGEHTKHELGRHGGAPRPARTRAPSSRRGRRRRAARPSRAPARSRAGGAPRRPPHLAERLLDLLGVAPSGRMMSTPVNMFFVLAPEPDEPARRAQHRANDARLGREHDDPALTGSLVLTAAASRGQAADLGGAAPARSKLRFLALEGVPQQIDRAPCVVGANAGPRRARARWRRAGDGGWVAAIQRPPPPAAAAESSARRLAFDKPEEDGVAGAETARRSSRGGRRTRGRAEDGPQAQECIWGLGGFHKAARRDGARARRAPPPRRCAAAPSRAASGRMALLRVREIPTPPPPAAPASPTNTWRAAWRGGAWPPRCVTTWGRVQRGASPSWSSTYSRTRTATTAREEPRGGEALLAAAGTWIEAMAPVRTRRTIGGGEIGASSTAARVLRAATSAAAPQAGAAPHGDRDCSCSSMREGGLRRDKPLEVERRPHAEQCGDYRAERGEPDAAEGGAEDRESARACRSRVSPRAATAATHTSRAAQHVEDVGQNSLTARPSSTSGRERHLRG